MIFFDTLPIFGAATSAEGPTYFRPREISSTFGLDGLEGADIGNRGAQTLVRGMLSGLGAAGLAGVETTLRSYQDGQPHIYTDPLGITWPNVLLRSYKPVGKIHQSGAGYFYRNYVALLLHLE